MSKPLFLFYFLEGHQGYMPKTETNFIKGLSEHVNEINYGFLGRFKNNISQKAIRKINKNINKHTYIFIISDIENQYFNKANKLESDLKGAFSNKINVINTIPILVEYKFEDFLNDHEHNMDLTKDNHKKDLLIFKKIVCPLKGEEIIDIIKNVSKKRNHGFNVVYQYICKLILKGDDNE